MSTDASAVGVAAATSGLPHCDSGVALSPRGEIVIDDRGATSLPGVLAAGDALGFVDEAGELALRGIAESSDVLLFDLPA